MSRKIEPAECCLPCRYKCYGHIDADGCCNAEAVTCGKFTVAAKLESEHEAAEIVRGAFK